MNKNALINMNKITASGTKVVNHTLETAHYIESFEMHPLWASTGSKDKLYDIRPLKQYQV